MRCQSYRDASLSCNDSVNMHEKGVMSGGEVDVWWICLSRLSSCYTTTDIDVPGTNMPEVLFYFSNGASTTLFVEICAI